MDEKVSVLLQDMLWLLVGGLLLWMVMTDEAKPTDDQQSANCRGASVMVEIRWPDGFQSDVDLWMQAPGDGPVGYSRLRGTIANLMRDDLGTTSDILAMNYEIACSRGVPAGAWTFNIHLYRQAPGEATVPIDVKISGKSGDDSMATRFLIEKRVIAERAGQEITVIRFETDSKGQLIPGSEFDAPRPLRTAG